MKHRRPTVKEIHKLLAKWGKDQVQSANISEYRIYAYCIRDIQKLMEPK